MRVQLHSLRDHPNCFSEGSSECVFALFIVIEMVSASIFNCSELSSYQACLRLAEKSHAEAGSATGVMSTARVNSFSVISIEHCRMTPTSP
jgi:hypothetical protein